jgi:type IV fimbrial biogenesis protein FimT
VKINGFTFFELVLTLALLACLATLFYANLGKVAANNRIHTEINALFHGIHLARKESVVRRRVVSLCPSPDGSRCVATYDWPRFWIVFENRDRDEPPVRDAQEALLYVHETRPAVRIRANRMGFSLRSTDLRATNGTIRVCDRENRVPARAIVISYTGRPRVALTDSRGDAYECLD